MPVISDIRVVRWSRVGRMLRALLGDIDAEIDDVDPAERARFAHFVRGITAPLVLLEQLGDAAAAAADGDRHARRRLGDLLRHVIGVSQVINPAEAANDDCCDPCGGHRHGAAGRSELLRVPISASTEGDVPIEGVDEPEHEGALDETAATELLGTVGQLSATGALGADLDPAHAMGAIVSLAIDAHLVSALVAAHRTGGASAAVDELRQAGRAGSLVWVGAAAPPLQTMMGAMPAMPRMPGMPGGDIPVPGDGLPSVQKGPGTLLDDWLAEVLKKFRKPKKWDPEAWDPYPWWTDPPAFIDPRTTAFLACILAARRILRALEEPPPPAPQPPPRAAVWSTGITDVRLTGPCAGETITIRGTGFGATQPADTVLLLPTLYGCRAVVPTSWTDTAITAVLPARVASGPVGFGDKPYIDAYNAWVGRMNALVKQLKGLRCHPTTRELVAPFGTCPPGTRINTIKAGVAEIVSFTANDEAVTVLEDAEHLTLRWTIRNASSVTITRDTPGAPSLAGSSSLASPLLVGSHAFGAVSHTGPAEWRYTLRVAGPCGTAATRTVRVYTAKEPRLSIEAIQVTQSIQTAGHTVRMVESKPTVVRVLVRHGIGGWAGGQVPNVRGRIRMLRGGGWSGWLDAAPANLRPMQATPGTSITVIGSPSMNEAGQTLNFMLPTGWASGTARYQVEVRVNGFGAVGGYPGATQIVVRNSPTMTYEWRRTLQLRWVRVNWNGAGAPTPAQCENTLRGAIPLLPTPTAGIAAVPGVGIESRSSGALEGQIAPVRRDMLDDFDDLHNCDMWEELTEWLGSDCPDDDGAIWVLIPGDARRGEAHDTPSNVCYTPPDDGPYAAHELAHCLRQSHVRLPASGPNAPRGGDAASASPWNGAMLVDVPFDTAGTAGSGTGANPRALPLTPGSGVADVMTYWGTPNSTWPMPERWERLWNEIGWW